MTRGHALRREASYRHGMRVRVGPTRARGVLLKCESRAGRTYWKVRLQGGGGWVWPDASLLVDGAGEDVATCASCALPFLRADVDMPICERCTYEQHGPANQSDDAPAPLPFGGTVRRRSHS